jgi:hypothetical protein
VTMPEIKSARFTGARSFPFGGLVLDGVLIVAYRAEFDPASGVWTFSGACSKRPTGEQKTAQGFSPGNDTHKEIALKGRPNGIDYNV